MATCSTQKKLTQYWRRSIFFFFTFFLPKLKRKSDFMVCYLFEKDHPRPYILLHISVPTFIPCNTYLFFIEKRVCLSILLLWNDVSISNVLKIAQNYFTRHDPSLKISEHETTIKNEGSLTSEHPLIKCSNVLVFIFFQG